MNDRQSPMVPERSDVLRALERWREPLQGALLVIAVVTAFATALGGGFVFDDHVLVDGSGLMRGPLRRIWFSADAADYWPLSYTTFWLEWRLWGGAPVGYHLVNVGLHAAAALLFWRILARLQVPGAWLAALLFAVHPANVESVAWISERKNVLSGALYAASVLSWVRHRDHEGRHAYAVSLCLFGAALLAKTSTTMLPLVLLGIVLFRQGAIRRADVREVVPFFALALFFGVVTVWFQWTGAMAATSLGRSFGEKLGGAGWALATYLQTAFLPLNVAVVYPRWAVDPRSALFYAPLAILILVFASLWVTRRGPARPVLWAVGYHALLVLPVLGLIDIAFLMFSPVGNHLQYLALMGPAALVGAGFACATRGRWVAVARAGAGAVVVALLVATSARASAYRDDVTLWTRAIRESPQSVVAARMHAEQLGWSGRTSEALQSLAESAARMRDPADARRLRALYLLQTRQVDAALHEARAARTVRIDPVVDFEIAQMLMQLGRSRDAVDQFELLVHFDPESPLYRVRLGKALAAGGRLDEGIAELRAACGANRRVEDSCAAYAQALKAAGRSRDIRAELGAALGVDSWDPVVDEVLTEAGVFVSGEDS